MGKETSMEVDLVACAGTASEVVEAHAWASYECRRSASTGGTCKKRTGLGILLGLSRAHLQQNAQTIYQNLENDTKNNL